MTGSHRAPPGASSSGADEVFRLSMRTDNPRRRVLCVALLLLAGVMTRVGGDSRLAALLLASPFALLGLWLLAGWIRPSVRELVLDREALCWGAVGAAQERVTRAEVASLFFGDSSGAVELRTGARKPLPMEIVGASSKALARAAARLWPGVPILVRFEDGTELPPGAGQS